MARKIAKNCIDLNWSRGKTEENLKNYGEVNTDFKKVHIQIKIVFALKITINSQFTMNADSCFCVQLI